MNPIKYRVWIDGQMLYPKPFVPGTMVDKEELFLRMDGTLCWCPSAGRIDAISNEHVVMLWTGLHDKNGKEIYKGDILRFIYPSTGDHHTFDVQFIDGCFIPDVWRRNAREREVIGNKYQNPELLK